eukprot:168314_1
MSVHTLKNIPLVDLSLDEESIIDTLKYACTKVGFFYVSNHGVPHDLIERILSEAKFFFNLDISEKEELTLTEENIRGYCKFGATRLDPENEKVGGTHERFTVGNEIYEKEGKTKNPFQGANKWPKDNPRFKETLTDYMCEMRKVSYRIVQLFALVLGIKKDHFRSCFEPDGATLSLIRYSADLSRPEEGAFACGAHSDWGMATLLATDGGEGLQIFRKASGNAAGIWEDVPHIPGTFIVNIGDMLQRWTNDRFFSARHRVVKRTARERFSVPFFYEPRADAVVEVLAACVADGEEPKYAPITYAEYLHEKLKTTHGGYADKSSK